MPSRSTTVQFVLTACPNASAARRMATRLVDERLAACINIVPKVESIYRWQGKIERAREWLLVIKSRRRDYPRLESRLRELHPYELPEIVAVPIARGLSTYLSWINNPDYPR